MRKFLIKFKKNYKFIKYFFLFYQQNNNLTNKKVEIIYL